MAFWYGIAMAQPPSRYSSPFIFTAFESIGILLLARIAAKISEQALFSKYSASPVLRFVATAVKCCGDL